MRRHDREVRTTARIMEIMDLCQICRIAIRDGDNDIYVLPMAYGYERFADGGIRLWFHSAECGKKLELIRQNGRVGFEMDCNVQLIESERPCSYSYAYMSLVGKGNAVIVEKDDIAQKDKALKLILAKQANRKDVTLKEEMLKGLTVFYVDVDEITGKEHV